MRTFNFDIKPTALNFIDIEDMGNCAIEGTNEDNLYYILVARTSMGTTSVYTCGPFNPDLELLPSSFKCALSRFDYSDSKLEKTINMFLNDKFAKITNAREITFEEAVDEFVDLKNYLSRYGQGVY